MLGDPGGNWFGWEGLRLWSGGNGRQGDGGGFLEGDFLAVGDDFFGFEDAFGGDVEAEDGLRFWLNDGLGDDGGKQGGAG